jgi:hypothetical protein
MYYSLSSRGGPMKILLMVLLVSPGLLHAFTQSPYEREIIVLRGQSEEPLVLEPNVTTVTPETVLLPIAANLRTDQFNCGKWLMQTYLRNQAGQKNPVLYHFYVKDSRPVLGITDFSPGPIVVIDNSKKVPTMEYRNEDKTAEGLFVLRLQMSQEDFDYATCLHRR